MTRFAGWAEIVNNKLGMILRLFQSPWLALLGRLVLGITFIWSSIHKIQDPVAFALLVYDYEILPAVLVNPFAYALPWVELSSGVLILLGLFTRPAASAQFLMLASFIIAIAVNLFRAKVLGCGCFSEEGGQPIGWDLVGRDLGLMLLCVQVFFYYERKLALGPWFWQKLHRD